MSSTKNPVPVEAAGQFQFEGQVTGLQPYGSGHINDTFAVTVRHGTWEGKRYILQRINTTVFKDPVGLMENMAGVTAHIRKAVIKEGGDPLRESLNIIPAKDGRLFYKDSEGNYWRSVLFIDNAVSYDKVENEDDLYKSACAFGRFQQLLADYPAETLHETIPDFHNTPDRLEKLKAAVNKDAFGRAEAVRGEIEFAMKREADTHILVDLLAAGKLPLRVTHNDTKLNNVLFDKATGKALCVVDLDTVMPGLSLYDYGDSIRFGATYSAEDERDLSKVSLDLGLFEAYTKGYLEVAGGVLTPCEIEQLQMGAKMITLECGIRFLTDYLSGDTYFKIHREGHNLDRCRTQFKLVSDIEDNWDKLISIIQKYTNI